MNHTLRSRLRPLLLIGAACAIGCIATSSVESAAPVIKSEKFEDAVWPYLQEHCVSCHNEKKQKGHFRVDNLPRNIGEGGSAGRWLDVIDKIGNGEMPPEDVEDRPNADDSDAIVQWLGGWIRQGEAARLAKREPVSLHRLSREEYVNTIYDLLGVRYDAADPGGLSDDPEWHGFERIGSVMSLSASHVEKYIAAAETVLDEAYPAKEPEPIKTHRDALMLRSAQFIPEGMEDQVRVDLWPGAKIVGGRPGPGVRLPGPGVYRVRVKLSGLQPPNGRAPHLTFYADKLDRMLYETDVVAPEGEPTIVEFEAHLPDNYSSFEVMNSVPGPSTLPRSGRSGPDAFISTKHGRIPWQLKLTDEAGHARYPFLILDWIEWEGPIVTDAEKAKRAAYIPTDATDPAAARAGLTRLAERAFRRPLDPQELDPYVKLVESEMAAGDDFRSAMKTAMLAILCSDHFLYIAEGSPDKTGTDASLLNDFELATRLSYFLWSTMPDDELFDLARAGKLHEPAVLAAQVDRMLAHPYAARFADAFPRQWLRLNKVGMFPPDSKLYPDYDAQLEMSMVQETTAFFAQVLEKNLSIREFIESDWTMVNARLATHYGIDGVTGDAMRRIELKPELHRGGVLTHASVLSLTSDGTRHRPVHRGVWVMESILGKSPAPPPANVDPIEPNPVDQPKATIRMKLEAHKYDPACASCHRKIDPLGLAFDHYDAIGRYRTVEIVQGGTGANPPVDASGELVDGRTFDDAAGFKRLLLDDLDQFNTTFVRKLATFAMRRAMTIDDRDEIAAVAAASKASDYRLRDTVRALVTSDLFRKR